MGEPVLRKVSVFVVYSVPLTAVLQLGKARPVQTFTVDLAGRVSKRGRPAAPPPPRTSDE